MRGNEKKKFPPALGGSRTGFQKYVYVCKKKIISNNLRRFVQLSFFKMQDCTSGYFDCDGVCDGENIADCAGSCDGSHTVDDCGTCDDDNSNDCGKKKNVHLYLRHLRPKLVGEGIFFFFLIIIIISFIIWETGNYQTKIHAIDSELS